MLVFELDDPHGAPSRRSSAALAEAGVPALVAPHAAAAARCSARSSTPASAIRSSSPREAARGAGRRARRGPRRRQPAAPPSARCAAPSTRRAARSRRPRSPTARAPEVASYRDLGAFTLLLSLQDDEALRLYCDSVLGPIEDGEGEYGGELLRSLEAFIEHNGQWERAARELYCHRHTLRYRIRRVEELTGRDLVAAPATGSSSGWRCAGGSWSDPDCIDEERR